MVVSFSLTAQTVAPGGGQFDPTQPHRKNLDFKKLENFFKDKMTNQWEVCGFSNQEKMPESFLEFYIKFSKFKLDLDPNTLTLPSKKDCPECILQKSKEKIENRFQCIVHDSEIQKSFQVAIKHQKEFSKFLEKEIEKHSKKNSSRGLNSIEIIKYYKKNIIDYE